MEERRRSPKTGEQRTPQTGLSPDRRSEGGGSHSRRSPTTQGNLTVDQIRNILTRGGGAAQQLGADNPAATTNLTELQPNGETILLTVSKGLGAAYGPGPSGGVGALAGSGAALQHAEKLAQLCEEILVYCNLLDNSRVRAVEEGARLRDTIKELEGLYDSANAREQEHHDQLGYYRKMLTQFDTKYYGLKNRAKQHIKECQDDRDRYQAESQTAVSRLKDLENELYSVRMVASGQMAELERLRAASKIMKSEREVNDLNLKLRRLENQNAMLATEKTKLQQQIDELKAATNRLYPGFTDSGGRRVDDAAAKKNMDDEAANRRVVELESMVQRLQEEKALQAQHFEGLLKKERDHAEEYQVAARALLRRLDEQNGGS